MGVIRNTASMQIRGRVGNTTYYVEGGRQIARVSQNGSNYGESASRTEKQQFQRGKWGNLVNFYKVSKAWMPKAYESKKRTQSDYNRFMQLNTPNARIYLTRNMYANGGCVADAYRISEGSLRPINVFVSGDHYRTDIRLGDESFTDDTTVGEFSSWVLENNTHLRSNMQLSFVSYQQTITPDGVPSLVCTAYEVTLDINSQELIWSFLPDFCCINDEGFLGTSNRISTGAFAYVLSETINGKTSVSTQTLITKNESLIAEFSSADAIAASIASYGVDKDIFLTSGSYPKAPTPQPVFLNRFYYAQGTNYAGSTTTNTRWRKFEDFFGHGGSNFISVSGVYTNVNGLTLWTDGGAAYAVGGTKAADGSVVINQVPPVVYDNYLSKIDVVLDGTTYTMEFYQEID